MTNTIEEWPREWQHNLLFHGVPVPDKESFYTKVTRDQAWIHCWGNNPSQEE